MKAEKSISSVRNITLIGVFVALMTAGAFIKIPFYPSSFTLQTLIVLMCVFSLGTKNAIIAQFIYIMLGLAGLPVFSAGGGIGYIYHPTFGFLLGFIVASAVIGFLYERIENITFWKMFGLGLLSIPVIYLFGVPYMAVVYTNILHKSENAYFFLKYGCLLFIPGDVVKAAAAGIAIERLDRLKLLPRRR